LLEPYPETLMPETPLTDSQDVSLCEALDRILNKGAVLFGEVMISVADIDLIYLGLQVILSSMETAGDSCLPREGDSWDRIFLPWGSMLMKSPAPARWNLKPSAILPRIMQGRRPFSRPDLLVAAPPGSTWIRTTSRTAWDNWS
jgi:hypothetical protein